MITRNRIRDYLDRMALASRVDEDGDIIVTIHADESFAYDVVICIIVEDQRRLSFVGFAPDYNPSGDILFLVNRTNSRRRQPTAVMREGRVRMEYSFILEEEVSEEYIYEICLRQTLSSIWTAFVELEQTEI